MIIYELSNEHKIKEEMIGVNAFANNQALDGIQQKDTT